MSRTAHKAAPVLPDHSTVADAHAITLAEEQETKQIEQDMFALAMQDVGAMRALDFIGKISDRMQVEIYLRQKKTRAYRAIAYTNAEGKTEKIPDLDTFCELYLGETGRNLRTKLDRYHMLGADLYESAERLGFKGRDYTALKALPADDQAVIKQALETDDRDTILSLMQELAAKHQSEKAALQAEATEAKETAEARDQVVKTKEAKISALEEQNNKLKRRIAKATPDEIGEQLREEVSQFAYGAEAEILGNLRAGFQALVDHADASGVTHENFMSGCLAQIEAALRSVREEFGVKAAPDSDEIPGWVKDNRPVEEIVGGAVGDELSDFERRHGYNPLKAGRA